MKETRHYCDRCKSEIKYFFIRNHFSHMQMCEITVEDVAIKDKAGIGLSIVRNTNNKTDYELCHKCKKEFKKFMNVI